MKDNCTIQVERIVSPATIPNLEELIVFSDFKPFFKTLNSSAFLKISLYNAYIVPYIPNFFLINSSFVAVWKLFDFFAIMTPFKVVQMRENGSKVVTSMLEVQLKII